ncbi:MAG: alanine racemase [Fimbriimonadales bacterium]|nr:alanine racemase [Fimbriimonadales bacterium]
MATFPRTWAEINLPALAHNIKTVRSHLKPGTLFSLVVKADAYGHGLVPISRFALTSGADWVAVATVQEGIALREAEIDAPILVLAPALPMEARQVVFYDLRSLVEREETAIALSEEAVRQGRTVRLHLKIDTGMSRFGVLPENAVDLAMKIASLPHVDLEGVATHFADAAHSKEFTHEQFECFQNILCLLKEKGIHPRICHCANSATVALYPFMAMNMVRVGLFAYGIKHLPLNWDLKPVLTWKTRIMAMRELPPNRNVGYGLTYTTKKTSRIATLGVGYGDGYPRALSNKGEVLIHGKRAPICGLVAMDQMMVDVTHIPEASIGDEVSLVEPPLTAEYLAHLIGTTPHEIPTRIMSRVPRRYIT